MTPAAQLQALFDREAIRECLYRYCRGIDRADEAALRSAYWEDATDCHGAWNGSAAGFIDRFERRHGEWRIAARTVVYDWIEERERPELALGEALFGVRTPVGCAAPQDPVYAMLREVRGAPAVRASAGEAWQGAPRLSAAAVP